MSAIRLPPQPRRVLFHHNPQLNKHVLWTQDFGRTRGWSTPEERDISAAITSGPLRHGTPSTAITRWAFSHPNCNHFMFVTQLTLSNYDHFNLQDVLTVLDSVPRLEELGLCRVNIVDNTTGALVRPAHMVRSLKRLAIEACNITEGLLDAYYDLLFLFLALFERIDRLRLVATVFRPENLPYEPNFYNVRLPAILHLEAEGFFGYVLVAFFREGYPVQELVSLHLSRCFASWDKIFWVEAMVRIVGPTLRPFAWRPNLEASWYGSGAGDRTLRYQRDFVEAFRRCTALRELEFGLYAHSPRPGHSCSDATSLFRRILDVLPDSRLDRLAFVLDLGGSSANVVPWAALDPKLSRVCVSHGQAVQVRIERHEARNPDRSWERMGYLDRRFWSTRLPTMKHKMLVQDRVRSDGLSVEQYVAPMGIDVQRDARLAAPGLRSLFDL